MQKLRIFLCTLVLCCFSVFSSFGQNPILEAQAKEELERRGLEEDEVRKRLLDRGIDIDKIDPSNPQEVQRLQTALEEVIKEIEAEKAKETTNTNAAGTGPASMSSSEMDKIVPPVSTDAPPPAPPSKSNPDSNETMDSETIQEKAEEAFEKVEQGATLDEALSEGIIDAQIKNLPPAVIYGQHIFRNKEISTYRNVDQIIAPDSYVLGTGDRISVSLWGYSQLDESYTIGKEGFIQPSDMARISLRGMTLGKAKDLLRSRFSNFYRFGQNQFEVTVTYPRTITVHIVGEVMNSGSFTMPAVNTAFNALAAAGGPSNIGSVRNIKLIRPGGDNRVMDVYEYLLDPSINKDYYLQNNDIIHVGVTERLVSIQGAIQRPYKYELTKEEQLTDLVKYAGGLIPNAYQGNFQIKRYIDDSEKILDVNYKELTKSNQDFSLANGDEVVIDVIPRPYQNFVEIVGAVELPGRYELEAGMKISDLVAKGSLGIGYREDIAYLLRLEDNGKLTYEKINLDQAMNNPRSPANIALQKKDRLLILSQNAFVDEYEISISGAVRKPSTYRYNVADDLKITDIVTLAGGLKEDATNFAFVYRKELKGSSENEYVKIDIKNAIENPDSGDNLTLKPNDRVEVFSVLTYRDQFQVSISGAVRKPSKIPYDSSEKLKVEDLVTLAGGLKRDATDFAYLYRIKPANPKEKEYVRINLKNALENPTSPNNLVLQPGDSIQVLSTLTYIDKFSVAVTGAVRNPGEYQYHESLTLRDALTLSGGLKLTASSNRIDIFRTVLNQNQPTKSIVATVEVDENFEMANGQSFKLEPFDQIVVRSVPEFELQQFVTIEGEVKFPGPYALLDDNEKITDLIQRAGGLTGESFSEGATLYRQEDGVGYIVLRLDQSMRNKKDRHNFILKEGDVITIPKRKDLVSITGATKAIELYPESIANAGKINVAYKSGKRAKWYINEYAAGVGDQGRNRLITVEHPNGEIKRTKNFLFFKVYPKVKKGSIVKVGVKPPKPPKEEGKEREKIDWGRVLADSVAQATAILSLVLLIERVN